MKLWLKLAIGAALLGPPLGLAASASGLIPIAASSGHWAITAWFLKFSMRRSVATHSIPISAPDDLDDPGLILRGAGHYETACRMCHGAPGSRRMPPVPHAMTPHPPVLTGPVLEMDDEELFYVVKHGVKFTGMPGWPSQQRDDEVWSMVAFLRTYPGLEEAEYASLVHGDEPSPPDVPEIVRDTCARCHGADGQGRIEGAFPRLAGQREAYLRLSLRAYADGERHSGIMEPIAASMTDAQIEAAAVWFSSQPSMRSGVGQPSPRGEVIATEVMPARNIPSCADCHGPGDTPPRHEAYPILAGQDEAYLRQQLELFESGRRGGTRFSQIMQTAVAHDLRHDEVNAVAAYYAGLASSLASR